MICLAEAKDVHLVHAVTMAAFEEYRHIDIPSSALSETVHSIQESLSHNKEQSCLYIQDETPIGSAKFSLNENSLYFSRLSVSPQERGKGIAKNPCFHGWRHMPANTASKKLSAKCVCLSRKI